MQLVTYMSMTNITEENSYSTAANQLHRALNKMSEMAGREYTRHQDTDEQELCLFNYVTIDSSPNTIAQ